jgi:hypothetical protein
MVLTTWEGWGITAGRCRFESNLIIMEADAKSKPMDDTKSSHPGDGGMAVTVVGSQ